MPRMFPILASKLLEAVRRRADNGHQGAPRGAKAEV